MRSFFWEKLPDARVLGTFWETHPPSYDALNLPEVGSPFPASLRARVPASSPSLLRLSAGRHSLGRSHFVFHFEPSMCRTRREGGGGEREEAGVMEIINGLARRTDGRA